MRLIRTALALTLAGTTLALAAPAVGSAATVTRIVIYKGDGDTTPVGPAGPLQANTWTMDTAPEKITTTNDGTLVEDTSLVWCCGKNGGEWWYKPSEALLQVFYWDQPGGAGKVEAASLSSIVNDNNAWINLGNGVLSPKCLQWTPPNGQVNYIELNTSTHDWSKVTAADACKAP